MHYLLFALLFFQAGHHVQEDSGEEVGQLIAGIIRKRSFGIAWKSKSTLIKQCFIIIIFAASW